MSFLNGGARPSESTERPPSRGDRQSAANGGRRCSEEDPTHSLWRRLGGFAPWRSLRLSHELAHESPRGRGRDQITRAVDPHKVIPRGDNKTYVGAAIFSRHANARKSCAFWRQRPAMELSLTSRWVSLREAMNATRKRASASTTNFPSLRVTQSDHTRASQTRDCLPPDGTIR